MNKQKIVLTLNEPWGLRDTRNGATTFDCLIEKTVKLNGGQCIIVSCDVEFEDGAFNLAILTNRYTTEPKVYDLLKTQDVTVAAILLKQDHELHSEVKIGDVKAIKIVDSAKRVYDSVQRYLICRAKMPS